MVAVGVFQSGTSDWDTSESESVPAARGTSSGLAGPSSSAEVVNRPPLASVTEKPEVSCHSLSAFSFRILSELQVGRSGLSNDGLRKVKRLPVFAFNSVLSDACFVPST